MQNVLYLSYDGMTDPLGQSQVLPYIIGLAARGYTFSLISFEKEDRFKTTGPHIRKLCEANHIDWYPLSFSTTPPYLSKLRDAHRMEAMAFKLYKTKKFQLVHCRSYISAAVGLALKKKYGVKFLFDMRGFWVDERVDGGLWNMNNPFFKIAYRIYKKKEGQYIHNADNIVSLTEAGADEIRRWKSYNRNPITIIPCSADFEVFQFVPDTKRAQAKQQLGLSTQTFVLSYLGSIGTWYMLTEMLMFFKELKKTYADAKFLFVSPDQHEHIRTQAVQLGINADDLVIRSAARKEIWDLISASDVSLMFIKEAYSKIASSPTKLGELLAMGIPVICNKRVGDVERIVNRTDGGIVVEEFTPAAFQKAIESIPQLLTSDKRLLREKAYPYYDLNQANDQYYTIYKQLLN